MLKVGLARTDITPEVGGWMDGMIRAHGSTSIHDPLNARAIVLEDGGTRAAIVSCEIVGLRNETVSEIREHASAKTNIPYGNVYLASMHNHSGPATVGHLNPVDQDYMAALPGKLVKGVSE